MCANILRYVMEHPSAELERRFAFDNWTHLCDFNWWAIECQYRTLKGFKLCAQCSQNSYDDSELARAIIRTIGSFFCDQLTRAFIDEWLVF